MEENTNISVQPRQIIFKLGCLRYDVLGLLDNSKSSAKLGPEDDEKFWQDYQRYSSNSAHRFKNWLYYCRTYLGREATHARMFYSLFLTMQTAAGMSSSKASTEDESDNSTEEQGRESGSKSPVKMILSVDFSLFILFMFIQRYSRWCLSLTEPVHESARPCLFILDHLDMILKLVQNRWKNAQPENIDSKVVESSTSSKTLSFEEFSKLSFLFTVYQGDTTTPLHMVVPFWETAPSAQIEIERVKTWIESRLRQTLQENTQRTLTRGVTSQTYFIDGLEKQPIIVSAADLQNRALLYVRNIRECTLCINTVVHFLIIENCHDCVINGGVVSQQSIIGNCDGVQLQIVAKRFRLIDLKSCTIGIFTPQRPTYFDTAISLSNTLAPYASFYPSLEEDLAKAGMDVNASNLWSSPVIVPVDNVSTSKSITHSESLIYPSTRAPDRALPIISANGDAAAISMLAPEEFFPVSYPFPAVTDGKTMTTSNPFSIPVSYASALTTRKERGISTRALIDNADLTHEQKIDLQGLVQDQFLDWISSNKARAAHLENLVIASGGNPETMKQAKRKEKRDLVIAIDPDSD